MAINVQCSQCGRSYEVGDELAGRKARCKPCGAMMQIPASSSGRQQPRKERSASDDPYGLADAEPALPPRAAQTGTSVPPGPDRPKAARPKAFAASSSSRGKLVAGAVVVVLVVLRIALVLNRGNPAKQAPDQAVPAPPAAVAVAAAPPGLPAFSPRGEGVVLHPGVRFFEVKASGPPNVATVNMTVWVYLPDGPHEARALPCVVVAPAGSIIITGMALGDGDRVEHVPYVRGGYAVLSYSLDGHLEDVQSATNAQLARASTEFIAAEAGLANARTAIAWMLENFPEVDPDRLYTAGHSSAGTMALLLAERDARFKACAAFAARANTEGNFKPFQLPALRRTIPGVERIFTTYNPAKHAGEMKCPVLLFHARDDSVVPVSETEAFAAALQAAGKEVKLDLVPSGDHYDPMVSQGIPHAMAFFSGHGSGASPP